MTDRAAILKVLRDNPRNVRFADLARLCDAYFGEPRVNIQNDNGKAKPYQVRQVLKAIEKLERMK